MLLELVPYLLLAVVLVKFLIVVTTGRCTSKRCLVGKTAIVTGAARGLGYEIATILASRGCRVIVADIQNAEESAAKISEETENRNVLPKFIDVANFDATRKFCKEFLEEEKSLDILIHNAGCIATNRCYTGDGYLRSLQTNHLGPFLMTHLLADILKRTTGSRVVFVSSTMVYFNKLPPTVDMKSPPEVKGEFRLTLAEYGVSKLYSLMTADIFAKKLHKDGVTVNSVNCGDFYSDMVKSFKQFGGIFTFIDSKIVAFLYKFFTKTIQEAAESVVEAAISKDRAYGQLYWDCRSSFVPKILKDRRYCELVWEESEKCAGVSQDERLT